MAFVKVTIVITNEMEEMVFVTKEMGSNKLEVQLELFTEHMSIKENIVSDMRIYEQGLLVVDHTRRAIINKARVQLLWKHISCFDIRV